METPVRISVVVPVYRSEGCIPELTQRLTEALGPAGCSYEVILVNDGSPDQSWERIREAAERHPEVRGINLRRNAGQDNAIMAGLRESRGEIVVVMDDDLQHDPRDIPGLLCALDENVADVCFARFPAKKQAFWKNAGSWLNDRLANVVVGKPPEIYLSPFKAIRGDGP
jgi:undecaprenyl-phosphate 4-deoxy-4-formamido-L-arabinose transferase